MISEWCRAIRKKETAMFGLLKNISNFFEDGSDYKFSKNDIVYFADNKYNKVRTIQVKHRMSGWDADDWEYYSCICLDPRETWIDEQSNQIGVNVFGQSICEISQRNLFSTKEKAESTLQKQTQKRKIHKTKSNKKSKMRLQII